MGDIRGVIFKDGDKWVGQCLEYDIGAQADTQEDAVRYLDAVIDAEREESVNRHGEPFQGIPPAPGRFFEMWDQGTMTKDQLEVTPQSQTVDLALCA